MSQLQHVGDHLPSLRPQPHPEGKQPLDDVPPNRPGQNIVTCIYEVKVADSCRNVTVTWAKNIMTHCLTILMENPSGENHHACKIDLKSWQFWGRKGLKSFKIEEKRVDVFWDFRAAKITTSPEPLSDYYVAIVSEEEVALVLGDQKKEAFKRTKSRPSLVDPVLLHKKETLFGRKHFCSRTVLGKNQKDREIMIDTSLSGPSDPEMMISFDGNVAIRVMNLHWRFRGNETVMIENVPVQIFWDVHDWLYNTSNNNGLNSGQGFFIFRPTEPSGNEESLLNNWEEFDPTNMDFCHLLHAWRVE
ncbi:uncharacterized protein LOC124939544 [Impatiens glandulifera]|uniref:uncharacterized protein LOC124939544 n=1 Tax=Impatiens glandulifera TaxID=253017 RepID=UPI001FB09703|nr:uncharacterized protein LOC124939544 [Impatiens glandulifera]